MLKLVLVVVLLLAMMMPDDRRHADYGATIMPTSNSTMPIISVLPPMIGGYAGLVEPDR